MADRGLGGDPLGGWKPGTGMARRVRLGGVSRSSNNSEDEGSDEDKDNSKFKRAKGAQHG